MELHIDKITSQQLQWGETDINTKESHGISLCVEKRIRTFIENSQQLPQHGIVGNTVHCILKRYAKNKPLSVALVAEDLGFSKRTLQRYLQGSLTSYAECVDIVRSYAAVPMLLRNEPVTDTAELLGFKDRTSLTVAFKRWLNMSPSEFKRCCSILNIQVEPHFGRSFESKEDIEALKHAPVSLD